LFFITCIGLAFLSARQSKSLMSGVKISEEKTTAQQGQPQPPQTQPVQTQDASPAK
jgi:preprotein translocase subunit SecG